MQIGPIQSVWTTAMVFLTVVVFHGLAIRTFVVPESNADIVMVNGNPGVVFEATEYMRDAEGWAPARDDLQVAEDAVLEVAIQDEREPFLFGYRQYAGIVEEGDRKIVIHSMCKKLDDWGESFLLVLDGGPCFWQATYNVDTGEVEHFSVNGQA